MESFSVWLQRRLKPGYRIKHYRGERYGITDPLGHWLMREGGAILWFMDKEPGGRFKANLIAELRTFGAIQERNRTNATPRPVARVNVQAPKNAVIVAQETLRDTSATPRERALARNYLDLLNSHQTIRKLAQKLGRRLKEIESQID